MKQAIACALGMMAAFGPCVVAVKATDIYVTKFNDGSIWKLDSAGVPQPFTASIGAPFVSTALLYGPDNNFYEISEANNQVIKFNGQTGAYLGVIADGSSGLNGPFGISFGPDGNLYVASLNSNSILKYSNSGSFLGRFDTPGTLTQPTSVVFGSDGSAYVSSFSQPFLTHLSSGGAPLGTLGNWSSYDSRGGRTLLFGPDGDLFVSSQNGGYLRIDPGTGAYEGVFAFVPPFGVNGFGAGFADGNFYVSNSIDSGPNGGVLQFNGATGAFVQTVFSDATFRPGGLALVPEPGTLVMLGAAALMIARRKPRRA